MKILRIVELENRFIRLVEDQYVDQGVDFSVYTTEFKIQVRVLFFWITIKTYDYSYDDYTNISSADSEIAYNQQCAEEMFNFIVEN